MMLTHISLSVGMYRESRERSCLSAMIKCSLSVLLISLSISLAVEAKSTEDDKDNRYRVKDLSYGVALYEFFQQNYFYAMNEIMVAQQQNTLTNHQDASELLLGGIQLVYGMDQQAQLTFESILDKSASPIQTVASKKQLENRARAWFYLGKLAYQKNNIPLALSALSRVDDHLTPALYDELAFLHEKSVFEIDKHSGEAASQSILPFTPKLSKTSIYRYYRDYNSAVNAVHLDDTKWQSSARKLEGLYKAINQSNNTDAFDELMELRDKILTTLGYLYLREGDSDKAIHFFSQVQQDSTQEGSALVGYGWAAINKKNNNNDVDYEAALTPWLKLQARSMAESTTYEALLAVPFIYNASGLNQQALKAYDYALEKMTKELDGLKRLTSHIHNYQNNNALSVLIGFNAHPQSKVRSAGHWLDSEAVFFAPAMVESKRLQVHLSELLAKKSMRSLFGQLNDIYWLENHLQTWRSRIDTFDFAIKERQSRGVELLSGIAQDDFSVRLNKMIARYDQLSTLLLKAQQYDEKNLLLTNNEEASKARIENALLSLANIKKNGSANISATSNNQLPSQEELKTIRLTLERMQKVLYWQASIDQVSRVWEKQKLRDAIGLELEIAKGRVSTFPTLVNKITEQTQYRQRLEHERLRIDKQSNDLALLREKVELNVVTHLNKELLDRKARLLRYIGKARLSKAALLERQLETSSIVKPKIHSVIDVKKHNKSDLLREQS